MSAKKSSELVRNLQESVALARRIEREQRTTINALRKLLKPGEVRLHHLPSWVGNALRKAFKQRKYDDPVSCLFNAFRGMESIVDHWGSIDPASDLAFRLRPFVLEPYSISAERLARCEEVARVCGANVVVEANSWWYPGRTIRIAFYNQAECDAYWDQERTQSSKTWKEALKR